MREGERRLTAIVGGVDGFDPVTEAMAAVVDPRRSVRFDGILGLLDAVRGWCAAHGPIDALDVVGHASAGTLVLSSADPDELLSVCHRSFGYLVQLRGPHALPDGAPVTFVGCEIAARSRHDRTQDGPLVLLAVSRYLGCPVAGTTRSIALEDFGPQGLLDGVRQAHTLVVAPGSALPADGWLAALPALPGAPLPGLTLRGVAPDLGAVAPALVDRLDGDAVWDAATLLDRPGPAIAAGRAQASVTLDGRAVAIRIDGQRLIVQKRGDSPNLQECEAEVLAGREDQALR